MAGTLIKQPFANAGTLSVPPQTDPSGFVNWATGYTTDYEIDLTSGNPQAKAVERSVQNALFNILSANQQQWQRLGLSEWFSAMPGGYDTNAQVVRQVAGVWTPFRSTVDANVSDPIGSATWEYVPSAHEALGSIPMPAGGAAGSAALLVIAATDFNTFSTGTWDFKSDAVAVGSANAPAPLGGVTTAGMLEGMSWVNGATTYSVQRYTDRLGNAFTRGASNGAWTSWQAGGASILTVNNDVSATVNVVQINAAIPNTAVPDNSQFWVHIANTNNGAATFTPKVGVFAALPIVGLGGAALQGGELLSSGRALFAFKSDTNNYVLIFCTGAPSQIADAQQSHQATTLGQTNAIVQAAASQAILYFMGQI